MVVEGTGMRSLTVPKLCVASIAAVPFFWLSAHLLLLTPPPWALIRHAVVPTSEEVFAIAMFWCGTLLTALAVGMLLALAARAVGLATIRTVLTPPQAQRFGLLATSLVWLALTGYAWATYSGKSELEVAAWYLALGVFFNVFNVVFLLLGIRAAASVRQLRTAGTFFAASFGSFVGTLGVIVLLAVLFNGIDIQPTLPLFGLLYLLVVGLLVLPPALAIVAGAALCSGVLAARATGDGSSARDV
jgi:hypothetical protein